MNESWRSVVSQKTTKQWKKLTTSMTIMMTATTRKGHKFSICIGVLLLTKQTCSKLAIKKHPTSADHAGQQSASTPENTRWSSRACAARAYKCRIAGHQQCRRGGEAQQAAEKVENGTGSKHKQQRTGAKAYTLYPGSSWCGSTAQ